VEAVATVFVRHGFEVHENVSGYTGGNIVATYGRPQARVHALQIEINAALLTTTARDEVVAVITQGGVPARAAATIARVREALQDVVTVVASVRDLG
jgi:N-formylglutamate amidohydrolase